MFENITVDDIKKDLARIPKRRKKDTPYTKEEKAAKAYTILIEKLKKSIQKKQQEEKKKLIRIDYLCK